MDRRPPRWSFLAATPGRRFINQFRRRRGERSGLMRKIIFGGGGTLIALVGVVLLFAPGPGTLLLLAGAALIAQQSERAARLLDWLEIRTRRITHRLLVWWLHTSTMTRAAIVVIAIAMAGVVFWVGLRLYFSYFG